MTASRVLFLLAGSTSAPVHLNTVSYPTFTIYPDQRQVHLELRLKVAHLTDLVDFGRGLLPPPSPGEEASSPPSLTEETLRSRLPRILALLEPSLRVESDGERLAPVFEDLRVTARSATGSPQPILDDLELRFRFESPSRLGRVRIASEVFAEHDPDHRGIGKIRIGTAERPFVFRRGAVFETDARSPAPPTAFASARTFLRLGMDHIFSGADHLLFLAGLLLASRRFRILLGTVTGFTIAHSTTLVAASLRWLTLPPAVVEPAIAASVVFVGVDNLLERESARRWLLASAFGLVHGLGFAGFIREVGLPPVSAALSLASFNVGVEAGQAILVAIAYPLLSGLRRGKESSYRRFALRGGSAAIAAAGAAFFVHRIA